MPESAPQAWPTSGGEDDTGTARIIIGRVSNTYGVRGWIRLRSYTRPKDNVLSFPFWSVQLEGRWRQMTVLAARRQGRSLVAHLQGCDDVDTARGMLSAPLAVPRTLLPPLQHGEYYWTDLVGMTVRTRAGVYLGRVQRLLETGANDVLVVQGERERLIPFIGQRVIKHVDVARRCIAVDWEREF